MPQTSVATGTFPSRKAADKAIDRLVSGGFARNSIELHRHEDDEGYDLEIHTRAENLHRARRLINASSSSAMFPTAMFPTAMSMRGMGQMANGAVQTARSHPLVLLGAGLLAGFVLYNLIPRSSGHEPERRNRQQRTGRPVRRPHRR